VWLSPEQVRVLPITDDQVEACRRIATELESVGLRAWVDDRSGTLNYKIREAETQKVPYMAVVGAREAEAGTVAVRRRGAGKKQEIEPLEAFIGRLKLEVETRALS
jgi:threonyl-tRNA synthetase